MSTSSNLIRLTNLPQLVTDLGEDESKFEDFYSVLWAEIQKNKDQFCEWPRIKIENRSPKRFDHYYKVLMEIYDYLDEFNLADNTFLHRFSKVAAKHYLPKQRKTAFGMAG
jgi:hypothetical protein